MPLDRNPLLRIMWTLILLRLPRRQRHSHEGEEAVLPSVLIAPWLAVAVPGDDPFGKFLIAVVGGAVGAGINALTQRHLEIRRERRAFREQRRRAWAAWLSAAKIVVAESRRMFEWKRKVDDAQSSQALAGWAQGFEASAKERDARLNIWLEHTHALVLMLPKNEGVLVEQMSERFDTALSQPTDQAIIDALHDTEEAIDRLVDELRALGTLADHEPRDSSVPS